MNVVFISTDRGNQLLNFVRPNFYLADFPWNHQNEIQIYVSPLKKSVKVYLLTLLSENE